MAEYTKIKTARTIICELCNELYPDDPCEPADCDWLRMLEEDAVSVPQWISVEDRLPMNYIDVLVFDAVKKFTTVGAMNSYGEWEVLGRRSYDLYITHWMPLPKPTKGENDG